MGATEDLENGTYRASITPTVAGPYHFSVAIDDQVLALGPPARPVRLYFQTRWTIGVGEKWYRSEVPGIYGTLVLAHGALMYSTRSPHIWLLEEKWINRS